MKNLKNVTILCVILSFFYSCSSDDIDIPYILYKDASGKVIDSFTPISVDLNSSVKINAEVGFHDLNSNHLNYEWKIDNAPFKQYTVFDGLNIYSLGGFNNLATQKATLEITFSDQIMASGSQVIVRIRDMDSLSKELIFQVK